MIQFRNASKPMRNHDFSRRPWAFLAIAFVPNVEAARACGWHAIAFTDAAQLKRDLLAYRIVM